MESWIPLALPGAIAYASSMMGSREKGEDIVQDCLCRLLARASHYDLENDGRKLLFQAITNACINHHKRDRKLLSLDDLSTADGRALGIEDASSSTPLELVVAKELETAIAAGLEKLPVAQRSALELSSFGYRATEIGEMLEITAEHARVLIWRARKAMMAFLQVHFQEEREP